VERKILLGSLGTRFDIRELHDRLLGNGGVTMPMLRHQIERWIGPPARLNNYSAGS
jgi:uncharacterized protein (DUF885 family)